MLVGRSDITLPIDESILNRVGLGGSWLMGVTVLFRRLDL